MDGHVPSLLRRYCPIESCHPSLYTLPLLHIEGQIPIMDPLSITALVISVVQLTGACLKSSGKFLGSSKHNPKGLQELTVYLYSFNAAVSNLQTHLDVCEEDQARLHALSSIQKPLEKSMESLTLIKTRLEDTKTVGKYLRGVAFDKKLGECLESLDTARKLFDQVLQLDNRSVFSSGTES